MIGAMMTMEEVKRLNLVDLLHKHYGINFEKVGERYIGRSPFTRDENPSFYVWLASDGHWVFKDFSADIGGTLVDFIMHKESCPTASSALSFIAQASFADIGVVTALPSEAASSCAEAGKKNLDYLYNRMCANDTTVVRSYLLQRGIDAELVDELIERRIAIHNNYKDSSYCCFAVRDKTGKLTCLDNHAVNGGEKFVLGHKIPFSLDHEELNCAQQVFVCEGIVDYLSIKTLMSRELAGIALLGSSIKALNAGMFAGARLIISALDMDDAGIMAYLELRELFADKEFSLLRMDECNDPNEYLQQVRAGKKPSRLSSSDKLAIYREFLVSDNKTAVAARWGINRAYMYEIVSECEQMITEGYNKRKPGRKPTTAGMPQTLVDARARIAELEREKRVEIGEREKFFARSEFLKIRLKYVEQENAELRGDIPITSEDETPSSIPKRQAKKKRRSRR